MNRLAAIALTAALAWAIPASAQNGAAPAPPVATGPTATPPVTTSPTTTPPPDQPPATPIETPPVANQPAPAAAPPPQEAIPISPDARYPNGFQDPEDPFANSQRADNDREAGFPWGLLGLLGLLGLIPLFRNRGPRTIYVEREDARRGPARRDLE